MEVVVLSLAYYDHAVNVRSAVSAMRLETQLYERRRTVILICYVPQLAPFCTVSWLCFCQDENVRAFLSYLDRGYAGCSCLLSSTEFTPGPPRIYTHQRARKPRLGI